MDLSNLTRPAILCQCSRCSSSLAVLENEWAKLSNSYSVAAGWLSAEIHRISVSPERKQVPQSSDLILLRGRILQEIACKLCQQKLGVVCSLDAGPNIFWKLSKVSFREIVTMRTVEPIFKDGLLERLIHPPQKESSQRDKTPVQPGALVPIGSSEMDHHSASMEQQIQHQGLSLDHISSSVSNLHDTMSELKGAFTALRIELNGPGRFSDLGSFGNNDFDMITTMLKELKNKSEEIERLKLEIEALKLKNLYAEEQNAREQQPISTRAAAGTIPEVRSPGLLQAGKKRPWSDSWPNGRTHPIADSFDDFDEGDSVDFSLEDSQIPPIKIPLKGPETGAVMDTPQQPTAPESSKSRIETNQSRSQISHWDAPEMNATADQRAILKRPRMSQTAERAESSADTEKRKPGRPRKSLTQATRPDFFHTQTPRPTPLSEQNANVTNSHQKENLPSNTTPSQHPNTSETRPGRSRSLRSRSRPSSRRSTGGDPSLSEPDLTQTPGSSQKEPSLGGEGLESVDQQTESGKENPLMKTNSAPSNAGKDREAQEKRKSAVAARDIMARLAMQREEAMETEAH
ncbi:hypothetical protein BDV28DRAFT_138454 [Aspergillus coremiiformis]|uniref:Yippee zinc-binding/DNA-binding /Mis18, centromere assembly-domain-containing protein n=1 Tax=Aspergillus coremiiformis TaxID=138285 RepID=A0A5N6Z466_9EURO|nr:hypothetical protein BDV28DRAFT_138454 [Aspergillus coremiiformis]